MSGDPFDMEPKTEPERPNPWECGDPFEENHWWELRRLIDKADAEMRRIVYR